MSLIKRFKGSKFAKDFAKGFGYPGGRNEVTIYIEPGARSEMEKRDRPLYNWKAKKSKTIFKW